MSGRLRAPISPRHVIMSLVQQSNDPLRLEVIQRQGSSQGLLEFCVLVLVGLPFSNAESKTVRVSRIQLHKST